MNRNKKNIIIVIGVVTIFILLGLGIFLMSYGYVTSDIINKDGKGKYFVVENLRIEYSGGEETLITNQENTFIPGATLTKTFTVKNTGEDTVTYNIILTDIINTFNRKKDITYELYKNEELIKNGLFPNEKVNYIVGDTNLDGEITENDYIKLNNFFNNNGTLNRLEMIASDLNLDNVIDDKDSPIQIKSYIDYKNRENNINENEENIIYINPNIGLNKATDNIEIILSDQTLNVEENVNYVLKIHYLKSDENQIEDSGKSINAKISFEQTSK